MFTLTRRTIHRLLLQREPLQPHALSEPLQHTGQEYQRSAPLGKQAKQTLRTTLTNLHAVREHDAYGHEFGEDPEKLGVGQHAVLQAVVQEAGVVAEHVVNVGRLSVQRRQHHMESNLLPEGGMEMGELVHSLFSGCSP